MFVPVEGTHDTNKSYANICNKHYVHNIFTEREIVRISDETEE